jgi:hypothetical protein
MGEHSRVDSDCNQHTLGADDTQCLEARSNSWFPVIVGEEGEVNVEEAEAKEEGTSQSNDEESKDSLLNYRTKMSLYCRKIPRLITTKLGF